MDWDAYRFFLSLHRHGNLKKAAKELKVDQTTVGRRISALEKELGTRLFEKRSDGYLLTLAGERIFPTILSMEEAAFSVDRVAAGHDEKIKGLIRVAMPGAWANHWLVPRLTNFMHKHPEIEFEFLTGPEVLNLAKREADIAIRLVRPTQKDLIIRKIGELELGLYIHRGLLKSKKAPQTKEELSDFPFIGLIPKATSLLERTFIKKIEPYLKYKIRSAAWSSVFYAIRAGLGLGILPKFLAEGDPELVQIKFLEPELTPLWIVVHPDISKSARIQAVVNYILKQK